MSFEVIVKYSGDLMPIESDLGARVENLSDRYAIVTLEDEADIGKLSEYNQIEYIEKPFSLGINYDGYDASGISEFKANTNLTGEGVIVGIIDSGIDYMHSRFLNDDGTSKILRLWDQTVDGKPPSGFISGYEFLNEDINILISNNEYKSVDNIGHGTFVSGIISMIAPDAKIIMVKVGEKGIESFPRTTEISRAIKYLIDNARNLNMPIAINLSYGSNEGPHDGSTLFEQYIDDMALEWKNNIIVASGNEGDKGHHKYVNVNTNELKSVEVQIGNGEREIKINIWKNFADDFSVAIQNPSNNTTPYIQESASNISIVLGVTKINIITSFATPYSLNEKIEILLTGNPYIQAGLWKIEINGDNVVVGDVNIYLPISESLSDETQFTQPTLERTVTNPGTAKKVITVGSYDFNRNVVSNFSGRGDIIHGVFKPDLVAPGEDIVSSIPGNIEASLSGTSVATPFVTGSVALLMQWGIVNGMDPFLYGEKMKALLLKSASRNANLVEYPDNSWGYGSLSLGSINTNYINLYRDDINDNRSNDMISNSLLIEYDESAQDKIKNIPGVVRVDKLDYRYAILYVDSSFDIKNIYSNKEIFHAELSASMVPLAQNAVDSVGATYFHNNPNLRLTGRGVLVGIIDSGIDYMHPEFIYEDDTSKVIYLWDQTLTDMGTLPDGFNIGCEFTNEQINNSIKSSIPLGTRDPTGHGTKVSGIIGGRGVEQNIGVAPDCDFIVVKLKERGTSDKVFYSSSDFLLGVRYVYEKAKELNRPLVLNISLGTNEGSHDGKSIMCNYIYELSRNRAMIPVAAAGNEGDTKTHFSGKFENDGQIQNVEFAVGENQKFMMLQLWAKKPDKISVGFLSPSGELINRINAALNETEDVKFTLEGTQAYVVYSYPDIVTGDELIQIFFSNITKGVWTLKVYGDYVVDGNFDIYMQNGSLLSKGTEFLKPDPFKTIVDPANSGAIITVGAYNSADSSIYRSSSRGPTRDGTLKPDLVAPGVDISTSASGGNYSTITGTSASGAIVSGVVAMVLQWAVIEGNDPKMYTPKMKTYLIRGARKNEGVEYPSEYWGYGIVDVRGIFENIRTSYRWRYSYK